MADTGAAGMNAYQRQIAAEIGTQDAATLALVETLMREETGGVLDHLSSHALAALARSAYDDARAWHTIGAINGVALADYCTVLGLKVPSWAAHGATNDAGEERE